MTPAVLQDLVRRYVRLAATTNPGRALRWGFGLTAGGHFTADTVQSVLRDLRQIDRELTRSPVLTQEAATLRHSVRLRIFEMHHLADWRRQPYYYIERRGIGLVQLVAELVASGALPADVLYGAVRTLVLALESAESNLAFDEMAKLDALWAAHTLRQFGAQLRLEHGIRAVVPASDLAAAAKGLDNLARVLSAAVSEMPLLTRPLGADVLREWLQAHAGVDCDFRVLAEACLGELRSHREALRTKHSDRASPPQQLPSPRGVVEQVYARLSSWFGKDNELFDTLAFEAVTGSPASGAPRAAYRSVFYVTGSPNSTMLYCPTGFRDVAELELDMVHEVYPGHHWERTRFYRAFQGEVGCLIYDSYPHTEGWAKYCEMLYAQMLDQPVLCRSAGIGRATIALHALAVIRLHAEGLPVPTILTELRGLTEMPEALLRSLLIRAHVTPLETLSPMVGYLAFLKLLGDSPSATDLALAVSGGPVSLWGVAI